jgi:hypothetical protein
VFCCVSDFQDPYAIVVLLHCMFCSVSDFQDPYAIVVLLQNDLVVVDLTTPG